MLGGWRAAVGYQPPWPTNGGAAGAHHSTRGQVDTSMQAVYVPADDYTTRQPGTRSPTWTATRSCLVMVL